MNSYERLENLKLAKEFPPSGREESLVTIYEGDFDWLMEQVIEIANTEAVQKGANWKEEMKKVKDCPQRQDAALDQLIDLYWVSTKLGFYDAGDVIQEIINNRI
ncbi:hypothetical protein QTG56_25720 (plasmid) [Rossellomorea sp. AcN35-11]|nr:hypothetical protein [Rossellomorea aquimaris]WJV32015.1 hypothetical protein QTG56_25720 [Rossellomorea sp. AcN35-11]